MSRRSPEKFQTRTELAELQRRAFAAIRRPLGPGSRMQRRWPDGRPTAAVVGEFIKPNDRLPSLDRLEIYNKQYWFRLLDCLHDDFPGVRAVVGARQFDKLRVAYLDKFPSRSFTLRNLGSRLPQFLLDEPKWAGRRVRLAQEMARFEWAQVVAFDGPEKLPMQMDDLLGKNPARLRLGLQPHLTLLQLSYPLDEFLIALKNRARGQQQLSNATGGAHHEKRPRPARLPTAQPIWLGVYRHDNGIYYKRLDRVAFAILRELEAGRAVADACAEGLMHAENCTSDAWRETIADWFSSWMQIGWLCSRSRA
ncbi:MAG TPA: DNA-binding domain-containing protein [Tepidisphaeraceae bacterium]|jgi:hypothetical protein|nr:DNA-binding domain-containing protein [Tepidisphaeraceae bacterium]